MGGVKYSGCLPVEMLDDTGAKYHRSCLFFRSAATKIVSNVWMSPKLFVQQVNRQTSFCGIDVEYSSFFFIFASCPVSQGLRFMDILLHTM